MRVRARGDTYFEEKKMQHIGIIGLGFMGKMHFETYQSMAGAAKVVAIADTDPVKRSGDWSGIGGNIATTGAKTDLSGITMYENGMDLIKDPNVDIVDITLPTYMHSEYTLAGFAAGKHVICEKPMALDYQQAKGMAAAAKKAGKRLFIGMCIRFWPAYREARNIMLSGKYGPVKTAKFTRISSLPTWSWDGWLQDYPRSHLSVLDFHIHDADFVAHTFGLPKAVTAHATGLQKQGYDHIVTSYDYGDGKLVVAEGAWEYAPGYPFSMTFDIHMKDASLRLGPDGKLMLYPMSGSGEQEVKVAPGSGYEHELKTYIECVEKGSDTDLISPDSAAETVRMIEAEAKSAASGQRVEL